MLLLVGFLLLGLLGAATWQHLRYQTLRRERVDDQQPLLYPAGAFHAVTYLKVASGDSPLDALRAMRKVIEVPGGGSVVYAGLVGMNMVASQQIGNDWSALLLTQYPSREAFDATTARDPYRARLAGLERSYTHGAIRRAAPNLLVPLGLLAVRVRDILLRRPALLPFEPAGEDVFPALKLKMKEAEQLDAFRPIKDDAVVIFNLIQPGDAGQRKADRAYAMGMIRGMAEGAYGPMHIVRAVTVEGEARFSQFVAVYYPGIDHMQAMLGSTFMNRIGSGKQLGDSLAVATIPVLSKL